MEQEIVIFHSEDQEITLPVNVGQDTVWLNRQQMAELFGRDIKTIGKHINNALREELNDSVVAKFATTAADGKTYNTEYYNLDMIISVGYRVKSKRGVEFRRWANSILKQYILKGYALNDSRLHQLGEVLKLMKRTENALDAKQVLSVVEKYSGALDLLDSYDHQNIPRPTGSEATYVLTYEECRRVIDDMRFGDESDLFGVEKDDSFKGSIGNIYQSFGGQEIYPTLEEKAANLLYLVTKNHSFLDGNKRIAATISTRTETGYSFRPASGKATRKTPLTGTTGGTRKSGVRHGRKLSIGTSIETAFPNVLTSALMSVRASIRFPPSTSVLLSRRWRHRESKPISGITIGRSKRITPGSVKSAGSLPLWNPGLRPCPKKSKRCSRKREKLRPSRI